ncbi:MAG: MopE-related protein [Myxococcota bacterium]
MRWVLLAGLPGCTYITSGEFEDRLDSIDEDRDGSPHADDCDDEDDQVHPGADDAPYDGLDQDCDKIDLIDVDQDGFPGISEAAYEALGTKIAYPEALRGKPVDCDDTDPTAYPDPTHGVETLYDAVDSDCQRDNDFDQDGDGFIPPTLTIDGVERPGEEVLEEYLLRWGITTEEAGEWAPPGHLLPVAGDCDDYDEDVHPENALADVPYDGIDRDCDLLNDFDADGDCFMPPLAGQQYDEYVARYFGADPVPFCVDPELPFGDCVDQPDADLQAVMSAAGLQPAEVYPSTTANPNVEAPYDGVDQDCGRDNDFDADDDGFVTSQAELDAMNAYATLWGYEADVPTWVSGNPDAGITTVAVGDCDDTRFDTWPGALEVLGDGFDQDCAGDPDAAVFGFGDNAGDFDWTNPTNPEITRLGDVFLVMVGAESGSIPGTVQEFGISFPFSLGRARGGATPDERTYPYWKSPFATLTMQGLLDIALDPLPTDEDADGIPDPVVHTASNTDSTIIFYTYLNLNGIVLQTNSDLLLSSGGTNGIVPTLYAANSVDMVMDGANNPFALSCADAVIEGVYSYTVPAIHGSVNEGGDTCFIDAAPTESGGVWEATFALCTAGVCERFTIDDEVNVNKVADTADTWTFGDQDEGWLALIDATDAAFVGPVGGDVTPVFEGLAVTHLDVDAVGDVVYAVAVADDGGGPEVWLAYGDPDVGFTEAQLGFDDFSVDGEVPHHVAVYADEDRVAVAVSASTGAAGLDSVGWVFFAPAAP